jgi:hypothetical protein
MIGWKTCREGGAHKFQPRYDEIPTSINSIEAPRNISVEQLRKLMFHNVYVYDICVTCGMTVTRTSERKS